MAVYTTIDDPSAYFKVQLYTGNGSARTITFDDTDTDMQPDLVWVKDRDATNYHFIYDSVRGDNLAIFSNDASAEVNVTSGQSGGGIGSQASDGFTIVAGTSNTNNVNTNTNKYVAWCWKESATAGFDIVTFTGSGGTQNISHSLSAKPELILNKSRSASGNWYVYHGANTSAPETDFLQLQANDATSDNATLWNDTAPTTSVFTVGSAFDNTTTYVAYAFASKQGFSKFGSYTGNSNADGAFIYLGFRPAFIMIKRTNGTQWWFMKDNKRDGVGGGNPNKYLIYPNDSSAEETNSNAMDFLSNGFKFRESTSGGNNSGGTYIYMAFAEAPFVNSNGVPCNAR